jgi:hypothetical protein
MLTAMMSYPASARGCFQVAVTVACMQMASQVWQWQGLLLVPQLQQLQLV